MDKLKFYILQNFISIDQLFNVLLGGYADETLSSRAWRAYYDKKPFGLFFKPLIDGLFFFDKDHCFNSFLSERLDRQQPPENRSKYQP